MKTYVFDSYAILAFLEDEPCAGMVEKALREVLQGKARGALCMINWGEIYYIVMREQGVEKAGEVVALLDQYPLELISADRGLTLAAATFKGKYKVAYADCFAAALGQQLNATVLTGDPEFKQLENEVKILWLP
ncbi:MAG: type II toxin-antitoxin system VapC family toxin [Proteobacteria bacterium]|nr:type II toxin-antitoxin system VapC family toxin [Pseudomonadota bacterium]MBU1736653.1 type II toxin-antitoxin system VapC family toxin [Pseudomonadota bacterium]